MAIVLLAALRRREVVAVPGSYSRPRHFLLPGVKSRRQVGPPGTDFLRFAELVPHGLRYQQKLARGFAPFQITMGLLGLCQGVEMFDAQL
jgi:hypothetical protein